MDQFIDCCRDGDIEGIKNMSLEGRDLDYGFRIACHNGHYNVVRYLVELHIHDIYKPINIHYADEYGFRLACWNGHYNVVRYLAELHIHDIFATANHYKPINIHFYNEKCFRWACYKGHFKIVRYLLTLCKKHKYKPFNNYLMAFKKIDIFLL